MYCRVINRIPTDVLEVRAASIIRAIMEAARTSETSVDFQLRTRKYIPDDSELQKGILSEILGPHSGENVGCGLLSCDVFRIKI
jgi:hypothetical protein